jgi:hypothetical protein
VRRPDLLILAVSYGKSSGQPGYDARADFTANNIVYFSDLLLRAGAYN